MIAFVRLSLTELMEDGVLMAANEAFFWPLGLALTWDLDRGVASDLHVRQWDQPDGLRERIDIAADDEIGLERRERFAAWRERRVASMLPGDRP